MCGETGHFHKDCPKNLYQKLSKPRNRGKSACLISEEESCSGTESDEKVFGGILPVSQLKCLDCWLWSIKSHDTEIGSLGEL